MRYTLDNIESDYELAALAIVKHLQPLFDKQLTDSQIIKRYATPGLNDTIEFDSTEHPGEKRSVKLGKALVSHATLQEARMLYEKTKRTPAHGTVNDDDFAFEKSDLASLVEDINAFEEIGNDDGPHIKGMR